MAFRDVVGTSEAHPGRWNFLQHDGERDARVEVRVRPLNNDTEYEFKQRFGKPIFSAAAGVEIHQIEPARNDEATKRMAMELWTDIKNGWVRIATKEAATLYTRELDGDAELKVGDEVLLDGQLTEKIKWNLLREDYPLADRILRLARQVAQQADKDKVEARKNSHASSRAASSGATPTSNAASVASEVA